MFGNPIVNEKKWKVVLLDDACEGIGDGLHGTPKYDDLGDYPFINGNNLIDGVIKITTSTRMVNEETYKKHYTNINNNAILISINGTLGKLAFYNGEKLMLGKSACYCNLKSNINRDFVYSVMKTEAFAGYLDSNSTSSTIKNIGLKAMRAFRLIQPPSKMQIEYVDFAKQIDKSKFLLQQMIAKLELLKKSRFIEMFGCIGKDEKQWGLKSLKDCVEVNPQKSKDPLILSNSIEEVSFVPMAFVGENGSIDCSCIKNYDEVKSGFTYFKENDVLFAKITPCMENGKGCIAKGLHNGIGFGSTEFHVLRPLDNLCNPKWLYYVSTSQEMRRSAEKKMTGSAGQRRVPAKFLEDFKISIPPIELQKQFATFVSQVDKSKAILQKQLDDLVGSNK